VVVTYGDLGRRARRWRIRVSLGLVKEIAAGPWSLEQARFIVQAKERYTGVLRELLPRLGVDRRVLGLAVGAREDEVVFVPRRSDRESVSGLLASVLTQLVKQLGGQCERASAGS